MGCLSRAVPGGVRLSARVQGDPCGTFYKKFDLSEENTFHFAKPRQRQRKKARAVRAPFVVFFFFAQIFAKLHNDNFVLL